MSVIRPGLLAIAVSVFVGLVHAQDENPFARWDDLKRKTDPFEAEQPAPKPARSGGVEYFSALAKEKESEPATQVKRERLRVADKTQEAATAATTQTKNADGKPVSGRDPFVNTGKPATANGKSAVTAAAFTGEEPGGIQQTSSDFFDEADTNGEANPFSEFLGDPAETNPVAAPAGRVEVIPANPAADSSFLDVSRSQFEDAAEPRHPAPAAASRGRQTPTVTVEWIHHDEFSVGQECRCELVVENTGRSLVRNVTTEAVLPQGLEVISAKPMPVARGGSARWTIDELQPGSKQSIQLVVVPRQQGDVQLNAYVQLTAAASSSMSITQPQVAIKLEGPDSVEMGQQAGYTVHVTNPGTGTARNVVIQAAIPKGLEHRQGELLNIEIGTLNPGELRRARLSLTAVEGGQHSLAVRVIAEGDLAEDTTQVVKVAEPRLNIGLRGPAMKKTGQNCDFELVVVNEGSVDSNNVRAKYKVPEGFTFVSADAGGKLNTNEQTIEWFVGTLEPNRVRQFKVTLQATQPGKANHQVGVISEHGRMTIAEHATSVEGNAELKLTVGSSSRVVQRGERTVFEIRIENRGDSTATNIGLSCELPTGLGLEDQRVSGPSDFIADNGVIIFRSLPTLEPGKSAVYQISTRCLRAGNHRLRARVASESINEPLIDEASTEGR